MAKAKFKIKLTNQVYGILTVTVEMNADQREVAETTFGMTEEECNNVLNQKLSEFIQLLGYDDT